MTKNDAINFVKSLKDETGVVVISLNKDDIEEYGDEEMKRRFAKMNANQKKKLLSMIAEEIRNSIEEADEYGFGNIFLNTMDWIKQDDRIDDFYMEAEDAN